MGLCLVNIKNDTMILEGLFPVFVQEKVKGFRECALSLGTQEIGFDALDVGVLGPNNAQGF